MAWILALLIPALTGITAIALIFAQRKKAASSSGTVVQEFVGKIEDTAQKIKSASADLSQVVSRAQLELVARQVEETRAALVSQGEILKQVEQKLETSQKQVEEREGRQQDIKSQKEEDELQLQDLLSKYESVSSESIALEQRLAQSLKNLDQIMEGLTLTDSQRELITDLSNTLTSAGARLRELIMEYESVNERLKMLTQQHQDLEEEYTKLVEQQLGG